MPPPTGAGVKVTDVPEQTGLVDTAIDTLAATVELTTIVIVFDVAGLPDIQLKDEVITTVTTSPLDSVDDV